MPSVQPKMFLIGCYEIIIVFNVKEFSTACILTVLILPSDKYNLIMAKAILACIYSMSLQPNRCLLANCSMYNAHIIDLPVSFLCVLFIFVITESVNSW